MIWVLAATLDSQCGKSTFSTTESVLYIAIIYLLLVIVASVRRPMAGAVLASNAFLVAALVEGSEIAGTVVSVLVPGGCLIAITAKIAYRKKWRTYSPRVIDGLLLAVVVAAFASSVYSPFPEISVNYSIRLLFLGVGFFFLARLAACLYADREFYFKDFILGCYTAGLIFAVTALLQQSSSSEYLMRLTVGKVSSIPLAISLGLGLIANATLLLDRRLHKAMLGALFLSFFIIGFALVLANTRSVMLGLFVAAFVVLIAGKFRLAWSGLTKIVIVAGVGLIGVGGIIIYNYELVARSASGFLRLTGTGLGESETERIMAWTAASDVIREHPFLGSGAGVFEVTYGMYPHNVFLEVGSGFGLGGLVLLSFVLVFALFRGIKIRSPFAPALLGMLVFLAFVAQVSLAFWMHKMLFMCIAVISAEASRRSFTPTGSSGG